MRLGKGALAALLLGLALLGLAAFAPRPANTPAQADESLRFATVELWLEGATPLAAWQIELEDENGNTRWVGIEGGRAGCWQEPPYYDPSALQRSGRLVLAAYVPEGWKRPEVLPEGRVLVGRVHVALSGESALRASLIAAGDAEGTPVEASLEVVGP